MMTRQGMKVMEVVGMLAVVVGELTNNIMYNNINYHYKKPSYIAINNQLQLIKQYELSLDGVLWLGGVYKTLRRMAGLWKKNEFW